ncbi:hypothetical protein, partial [Salmonella sp. s51884]|uniref:hypothetical protein n=1 Tax=Salmonella sp. s51884 TaxID=3159654 RepID=UPI003980346C
MQGFTYRPYPDTIVSQDKGPGQYYYGDDANRDIKNKEPEILVTLKDIGDRISAMKQPTGKSKATATRSCRNLFLDHPDKDSGTYWVDPNLGCTDDAFEVYCEKSTMATCLSSET